MLRRAFNKRPYDWGPLLPAVLQAYRSTILETTSFTPHRLVFGREMRLPVDFGAPLPEPPRDVRTYASELAEDLEWCYRIARECTGFRHRRAEQQYNERAVEKQYAPGTLVRVVQDTHSRDTPSKLAPKYYGLCEVLQVRGPVLTLREIDTQRTFTANHDSVRRSTLTLTDPHRPQASNNTLPPANKEPTDIRTDSSHPVLNTRPRRSLRLQNRKDKLDTVQNNSRSQNLIAVQNAAVQSFSPEKTVPFLFEVNTDRIIQTNYYSFPMYPPSSPVPISS